MSTVDWDDVDKQSEGQYQVYPEAAYRVRIKSWERVKASTGTDQIRWKATIEDGDLKGKPVTEHTPLTEKSMWRIGSLIKACGITIKGLGKMEVNSAAFANVLNLCKDRTTIWHLAVTKVKNTNKDRNEVQEYLTDDTQLPIDGAAKADDVPDFLK